MMVGGGVRRFEARFSSRSSGDGRSGDEVDDFNNGLE